MAVWPNSPESQPTALDLRGSQGITLLSVSPHFRHSNVRCSKPSGPADTFAVIIRVLHFRQRGGLSVKALDLVFVLFPSRHPVHLDQFLTPKAKSTLQNCQSGIRQMLGSDFLEK
jgi:hypothetical protein